MSYFMLKTARRFSWFKYFHSLQYKENLLDYKVYCIANKNLEFTRKSSFSGFYAALSQSTPVVSLQTFLYDAHQFTNLPWWAIIMLTTLSIRTIIILPLTVHQHQVISRLANINAGLSEIATELNKEVNVARRIYKWSEDQSKKVFRKQMKKIYQDSVIRENCHPFKATLLVLIQVPVWVCFSVALRNLTMLSSLTEPALLPLCTSFKTEGLLWFPDLTCPDPIVLPLLLLLVNGSLIELHAMRQMGNNSLLQKIFLNGSRIITIVVAIAATVNPSSVSFYWLCSSSIGLAQSVLLMTPKVRSILRIPKTSQESSTPFSNIATNFKKRLGM